MQTQLLWLPNPGAYTIDIPQGLTLKVAEILPNPAYVDSISQQIGRFANTYTVGGTLYAGVPMVVTTNAPCIIAFDGVGQFAIVTTVADLPYDSAALLDNGVAAPRMVRKRADGTLWYGSFFSATP